MKKTTILTRLAVSCLCFLFLFPGFLPPQPPPVPDVPPVTEEPPIQPQDDEEPVDEIN